MEKYYPLKAISKISGGSKSSNKDFFDVVVKREFNIQNISYDDFVNFVFSKDLFSKKYNGPFKRFNDAMLYDEAFNTIVAAPMGLKMSQFKERKIEWEDALREPYIMDDLWCKYKIAYKIDNDFFHEIKNTKEIDISYEMFEQLPFKCFFVDLTEVKNISGVKGSFVYVYKNNNSIGLTIINVQDYNDEVMMFADHSWFDFDILDHFSASIDSHEPETRTVSYVSNVKTVEDNDKKVSFLYYDGEKKTIDDPMLIIKYAILQIIQFISMDASDIQENEVTKKTYRKSNVIKNKFSEVLMWDVGVRYGKAIRVARLEYEKRKNIRDNDDNDNEILNENKERKPTTPHIRRAHWHTYRSGKGKTERIVRWIAPIFVCCNGDEIPVTIREIKKE